MDGLAGLGMIKNPLSFFFVTVFELFVLLLRKKGKQSDPTEWIEA